MNKKNNKKLHGLNKGREAKKVKAGSIISDLCNDAMEHEEETPDFTIIDVEGCMSSSSVL